MPDPPHPQGVHLVPMGSSHPGADVPFSSTPQTPLTPTSSKSCHLPAACTPPAAFGPSQPVPMGWRDPKPALVSLPARSACPQVKSQSDTSVKHNIWQDALGSGSTSCQPPSAEPPPNQLPRDPKRTPDPNHSLKHTAAMGPAHLGGTSGALDPRSSVSHWRVTQVPPRNPYGPRDLEFEVPRRA